MKLTLRYLPIRWKIIIPVSLVLVCMVLWIYYYLLNNYEQTLLETRENEAELMTNLFSAAVSDVFSMHNYHRIQQLLEEVQHDSCIVSVIIFDNNGKEISRYGLRDRVFGDDLLNWDSRFTPDKSALILKKAILDEEEKKIGECVLFYSLDNLNQTMKNIRILTIAISACLFLVGFVITIEISRRITYSISRLDDQMHEVIDKGKYVSHVHVSSRDEVGKLADAFNTMMDEIRLRHQRMLELQDKARALNRKLYKNNLTKSLFIEDASHYLRTPLAIIEGELEIALMRQRTFQEYQRVLRSVQDETFRLNKIVDNLLSLASADSGKIVSEKKAIDFAAICKKQITRTMNIALNKKIALNYALKENCVVSGDSSRLAELTYNLLENAIFYTPNGNSININLSRDNGWICLDVSDSGIGIEQEEIEKIFTRFYRGKNARNQAKGSGLGLAICDSIVKAHKGTMRVTSTPGIGSTFEVRLKAL
ncbi:MAG: ATP-binding protein [bacterium]